MENKFKQARDSAADISGVHPDVFKIGANWSRRYMLTEDPVIKDLVEALKMHHQWQQEIGVVQLMPDCHELNLSLEYSDSTMCEKTMEALDAFEAAKREVEG